MLPYYNGHFRKIQGRLCIFKPRFLHFSFETSIQYIGLSVKLYVIVSDDKVRNEFDTIPFS